MCFRKYCFRKKRQEVSLKESIVEGKTVLGRIKEVLVNSDSDSFFFCFPFICKSE